MVPNLPYFMVQFDYKGEKGYGHVIEGIGGADREAEGDDIDEGEKGGGVFPRCVLTSFMLTNFRLLTSNPYYWTHLLILLIDTRCLITDTLQVKLLVTCWISKPADGGDQEELISGTTKNGSTPSNKSTINSTGHQCSGSRDSRLYVRKLLCVSTFIHLTLFRTISCIAVAP
jgi:hypothetical protein